MTTTPIPSEENNPVDTAATVPVGGAPSAGTPPEVPAHPFARIDAEGTVYVKDGDSERAIGAYPEGIPAQPYALYERRYADLEASVRLFEDRLAQLAPREIDTTLASIREQIAEPNVVGDLAALRRRVDRVAEAAQARKRPSSPRIRRAPTGRTPGRPCASSSRSGRPSSGGVRAWTRAPRTSCGSASPPPAASSTASAASTSRSSTRPSPRRSASRSGSSHRRRPCRPPPTGGARPPPTGTS